MLEITEKAGEMVKEALKDKDPIPSIRVIYNEGGWSGPSLGLVLDESGNENAIFTEKGITFIVNKDLYERAKPIKIDFVETPMGSGFHISSSLQGDKSCGTCSC